MVAVKVLRSTWDSAARRRFEREQRVMAHLSTTAGFVPIVETGETPSGSPYIIVPFYPGGSLQQRISLSGPIDWPRAVRLAEEVASTLSAAHEIDVFHRDIKPANILLTESGRPHVADFGVSLIADDAVTRATSTVAFTPAYSPPESFIHGLRPVAGTDIYSLAATMWAMLAGYAPFKVPGEQPTPVIVFGRVATQQVGDLRERVPSPICAFVERAMAKKLEDRPRSMADFVSELQVAREESYRGVEVPRTKTEPYVIPGPTAPSKAFPAGVSKPVTEVDAGRAPSVTGDVETVAIGYQLDPAGPAQPERTTFGWMVTAVGAAVLTTVVLLLVWMSIRSDAGDQAAQLVSLVA